MKSYRLFRLAEMGHNVKDILELPRPYRLFMYAVADVKVIVEEEANRKSRIR